MSDLEYALSVMYSKSPISGEYISSYGSITECHQACSSLLVCLGPRINEDLDYFIDDASNVSIGLSIFVGLNRIEYEGAGEGESGGLPNEGDVTLSVDFGRNFDQA